MHKTWEMKWALAAGAFCTALVATVVYVLVVRATVAVLERVWG